MNAMVVHDGDGWLFEKNTDLLQNRQWICWSKKHPGLPKGSQLVCRRSSRLYWRR